MSRRLLGTANESARKAHRLTLASGVLRWCYRNVFLFTHTLHKYNLKRRKGSSGTQVLVWPHFFFPEKCYAAGKVWEHLQLLLCMSNENFSFHLFYHLKMRFISQMHSFKDVLTVILSFFSHLPLIRLLLLLEIKDEAKRAEAFLLFLCCLCGRRRLFSCWACEGMQGRVLRKAAEWTLWWMFSQCWCMIHGAPQRNKTIFNTVSHFPWSFGLQEIKNRLAWGKRSAL